MFPNKEDYDSVQLLQEYFKPSASASCHYTLKHVLVGSLQLAAFNRTILHDLDEGEKEDRPKGKAIKATFNLATEDGGTRTAYIAASSWPTVGYRFKLLSLKESG